MSEIMQQVEKRQAIIRDQVRAVARGYTTCFFLYGPGGHGKSYAVHQELDEYPGKTKWILHNSHITAAALVSDLCWSDTAVHVFEDCEQLYKDKTAAGILRSACAAPQGKPRRVAYETKCNSYHFDFTGGIIIVSNESLKSHGVLGAIASRSKPIEWRLSALELQAIMMKEAEKGFHRFNLSPRQCVEVATFLVKEMDSAKQCDLRIYFDHALPTYYQWHIGKSDADWRDVLRSKIQGQVKAYETRDNRLERERMIAVECHSLGRSTLERLQLWKEKTGKGKQAYYDRLKEA